MELPFKKNVAYQSGTIKSVYKIRRADGLFSKGGTNPVFGKIGKAWTSKSALGNHLTLVEDADRLIRWKPNPNKGEYFRSVYKDCIVVQFDIVESSAVPVVEYNAGRKQK